MFCTQCGNEIEQHARFCSKCGAAVAAAAAVTPPVAPSPQVQQQQKKQHDMDMHINILAWLLIGSSILTAFGGMLLLFAGQVVRHMPFPLPPDMPIGVPHLVGRIAGMLGLAAICLAAGGASAGVGLLQYRSWARALAIIVAVLLVFHFPIGTVIAIYAFWVLFSQEGQEYYKSRSASTMA